MLITSMKANERIFLQVQSKLLSKCKLGYMGLQSASQDLSVFLLVCMGYVSRVLLEI